MSIFKRCILDFFYILFPDLCSGCKQQLYTGEKHICTTCLYDLPFTDFHLYEDNPVAKVFWGRINCTAAMAMLYFSKESIVQQLIHGLKYKGQTALGFALGKMLGERLIASAVYLKAELIIPVPLHPRKQRSRGYNQSLCIAEGIASVMQIPVLSGVLLRRRMTGTQTRKTRFSRFENMRTVFCVTDPDLLNGKHILLVDDVITTGATLESCAQVLSDCQISQLIISTIAYSK